jgi:uncharacterized protein (DUF488 family)
MLLNRRKLILSLLQAIGGSAATTDFFKLMFLLSEQSGNNYFDFFPYKYGAYSFTLQQDRDYLIQQGYLLDKVGFVLGNVPPAARKVDQSLQHSINKISSTFFIRGNALLKYTYEKYPYYAINSTVLDKVLSISERIIVTEQRPAGKSPQLFTIGYEGLSIDAYLDKLIKNNISVLVDVRNNPHSRKFGFSKKSLQKYVELIGKCYIHIPELGVPSDLRTELDSPEAYQVLFTYYDQNVLPQRTEEVERVKQILKMNGRIALTCFEADYRSCHRSRITNHIAKDSSFEIPIVHL